MNKYEELLPVILQNIRILLSEGKSSLPSERDLSQTYQVSRQTIRKILSILESEHIIDKRPGSGSHLTGYLPGRFSDTVVIMTSDKSYFDTPNFIYALEKEIKASGLRLKTVIAEHNKSFKKEHDILEQLSHRLPFALIAEPVSDLLCTPNSQLYNYLTDKGVHVTFKGRSYKNLNESDRINSIFVDYEKTGYLSAKHLIDGGHRKIGGIICVNTLNGMDYFQGITSAMSENSIPYDDDCFIFYNDFTTMPDFPDYFRRHSSSVPSAFLIQNDNTALSFYKTSVKLGYHVPEDISILTSGDSYLRKASGISLTEFYPPANSVMTAFSDTLKNAAASIPLKDITLQPEYINGNTCYRQF